MLENKLSTWLRRVTGVGIGADLITSSETHGIPRVHLRSLTPTGEVSIAIEGHGSNMAVLLLLELAVAARDAIVMIEEPEIHLHPKAQAELASVLAEEAKAESKQLIMTTHSEHILGRLLTLVAEKKLAMDELAIYAFEKDQKGVCTASEIEVTEDGRVIGGLKDFFEADLAELDRYIRALQPSE